MKLFTNRALATAFAVSLILGSGSVAFADRGGNGQAKTHAKASAHAKPAKAVSAKHTDNDNDNDNDRDKDNDSKKTSGNSATAHSCVNPAGNTRGWCKSHAGGNYITGTVSAINGSTATIALSNGQTTTINEQYLLNQGHGLTVGQRVTLRGSWQNGVFVVNNGAYSNYGGPYSSASVRGLIISVNGNSLQIAQGLSLITVDATNAISRGAINGTLMPGRTITASGNWNGSTFIATSIQ